MKRGPKSKLEVNPTLQKRLCDVLEKCNTIKTAAAYCNVSERSVFSWISRYPSFAAAIFRARGLAKTSLVAVIRKAAPDDWRAAAWILERSFPDEYARTERIEQVGEQADDKNPLVILYDTRGQKLSTLLDFPVHFSMGQGHDTPAEAEAKQKKLIAQIADAQEPAISDAEPPSAAINKALTGRFDLMKKTFRNGKK